jgi:RNase H-fold protein (predicted Holliday junction resolvase)
MKRARRREVVDKVAAAVMLQSWLDRPLHEKSSIDATPR